MGHLHKDSTIGGQKIIGTDNIIYSANARTEGAQNVAGGKAYKIISQIDNEDGTGQYELRTASGLELEMEYSIRTSFSKPKVGVITAINTENDKVFVTVTNFQTAALNTYEDEFENYSVNNYMMIVGHPELGDIEVGFNSHAEGQGCIAHDKCTHVEGRSNQVLAMFGHAEGRQNIAGCAAHAEGRGNEALGDYSHAGGYLNKALGLASNVIGTQNTANESAKYSHVEGSNNKAYAYASHVEGERNIARYSHQHVQGKWNKEGNYAHIVGNGKSETERSNAHTLDWEGNAWFNGRLHTGNNTAGIMGYYFTNINFETNEITLSKTQGQNPTSEFNTKYEIGDIISLTNNAKYYNCSIITKINKNIITVDSLPFTSIYETNNPMPDEWNFFVISKPTYGDIRLGLNASAFGEGTNALERSSHAEGRDTIAYGSYSHAEGRGTQAAFNAHAEGRQTIAGGEYSHAEGLRSKALGNRSHAEGQDTEALDLYTHTEGYKTIADGEASHAEGFESKAKNNYSHAEGFKTSAIGSGSHTEGQNTEASGSSSHAEGGNTKAIGDNSHAEGIETQSEGEASHAEGAKTIAYGNRSHAEGQNTQANGRASHVEGINSVTSGEGAHAEGFSTIASGNYSHAEGFGTIANGDNQHVEGKYNKEDNNHKYIHISGNGYVDENSNEIIRSNAHTIDWNGNAWFAGKITIGADKLELATKEDLENISIPDIDLTNYVTKTDYATYETPGILTVGNGFILETGKINIREATDIELQHKCISDSVLTPNYLDYGVKYSTHQDMSDNYDVNSLTVSETFKLEDKGTLPVSYNAVKTYIDELKTEINTLKLQVATLTNN